MWSWWDNDFLGRFILEVTAGYHMNKRDWNSVNVLGLLSVDLLQEWIVNSYELVVAKLPKKVQKELSQQI